MRMRKAAAVLVSLVLGAGALAADPAKGGGKLATPATLYPKGTLAVVQTAPVGKIQEDLDAFGNACLGMVWMMAGAQVQQFFMSPVGQALDPERPIGVAILPPAKPGDEPRAYIYWPEAAPGALAAAVKQEKTDMEQTGMPPSGPSTALLTAEMKALEGGYVVSGEPGTLGGAAPGGAAWPVASKGLLVFSADVASAQQVFAREIEQGFAEMMGGMTQAMAAGNAGQQDAKMAEFSMGIVKSLLRQTSRFEAALDLSDKGLGLKVNLAPKKGSTIEKFVTAQVPGVAKSPLGSVAGKDAWWLSEFSMDPTPCAKTFGSLWARYMIAAGVSLDPDLRRAQGEMFAGPSVAAYAQRAGGGAIFEMTGVTVCANAAAAARWNEFFKLMPSMKGSGVSYKPKTVSAKCPMQCFDMVLSAPAGATPEQQMAVRMQEAMFGKGAQFAASQNGLEIVFAMGANGVGRVEEIVAARAAGQNGMTPAWYGRLLESLPAGAQGRGGVSLLGLLKVVGAAMEAQGQMNPMAMIGKMALQDSGIGFYGLSGKTSLEFGIAIPAETFGLAQQLMMPLMGAAMQGGMGGPGGMEPPVLLEEDVEGIPPAPRRGK